VTGSGLVKVVEKLSKKLEEKIFGRRLKGEFRKNIWSETVAHACNPSYSESRDGEGCHSRPA
jgi:hypothetical protein